MTKAKFKEKNFQFGGTVDLCCDAAKAMVLALNIKKKISLSINKIAEVAKRYLKFDCKIEHDLKFKDGAFKKVLQRSKRYKKLFLYLVYKF